MLRAAFIMAALDAGVPLRDIRIAARHADPRTTPIYDRRRQNFDRHAAYVVVAFVAGGRRHDRKGGTFGTVIESLRSALRLDDEIVETVDGDSGAMMARLIYASNMSLDGCTEDERGAFDWAPPADDVFAFITELMRSAGTYLYGRRMYETMAVWETDSTLAAQSDLTADYANVWQAADKVVYSSTLATPSTENTRLERHFDPRAVRDLKTGASRDLLVGGPNLAAQALKDGLVDELQLLVWPVVLGGRKPALPTHRRADLELLDEHRFRNGVVQLRYRVLS